jgi:hypothetical protein
MVIKDKQKKYQCRVCKKPYIMLMSRYAQRSMTAAKGVCEDFDCMAKASIKVVENLRAKQKADQLKRFQKEKEELKSLADWKKDLEVVVNDIVRSVDEQHPCIATGRYSGTMHAGHFRSVGSYPALRFNVWNIHKQCAESNVYKGGDTHLFREGLVARYGKDKVDEIDALVGKYPVLRLTIEAIKEVYLPAAKQVLKELKKGERFTRDEINEKIGIYL